MTTITPDMIQAFKEAYGYSLPWANDNIRAGLAAAFDAAAPDADPLARRVEVLERQMRDLHKVARREMDKLMATNHVISTPPAPDAEDAARDKWDQVGEIARDHSLWSSAFEPRSLVGEAVVAKAVELGLVEPKLVVTDELVEQCLNVMSISSERSIRTVLGIAAAAWGGEESHA